MCFPGMWCTPAYATVKLEDRPRVYYPNYHYPYGYTSSAHGYGAPGYGVGRAVYYAPPKIKVKGPKYAAGGYYPGYVASPAYGYGGYGAVPAPYCEPPREKVKYRYVPAGKRPDVEEGRQADGTYRRLWRGKTKEEIRHEDYLMAMNNGIYKDEEIAPIDPGGDDQFWCQGPNGEDPELLNYFTIVETMRPGKWKKDPRYGMLYFITEKKKGKA